MKGREISRKFSRDSKLKLKVGDARKLSRIVSRLIGMVSRAFIGSWSAFASERFGNRNEM